MHEAESVRRDDVFRSIRDGCRRVAEHAESVRIVSERLEALANHLVVEGAPTPALDVESHYVGDESTTVAFFVTLDAVNFGSGYFPHLRKRPGMSGYFTIASSLADRFRREGPIDASELAEIDASACARIFDQDAAVEPIAELMSLFAQAWNDLGADLLHRFGGAFCGVVEAAAGSAARLIEILEAQPFFRDVSQYDGFEVPLFKRAQILASDLALALRDTGPGRFEDLDRLTIFADNLVPHVLRVDGVLEYRPDLRERIEREELIPAGSEEEIEIRACALYAVELLVDQARARGLAVTARELDLFLWNRGQQATYKARPRHRTRTVFY